MIASSRSIDVSTKPTPTALNPTIPKTRDKLDAANLSTAITFTFANCVASCCSPRMKSPTFKGILKISTLAGKHLSQVHGLTAGKLRNLFAAAEAIGHDHGFFWRLLDGRQ